MFSRILTFSVLSVFCVLTAISSVYAGNLPSNVQWHNYCHEHDGNMHCHLGVAYKHGGPGNYHTHFRSNYEHNNEHNNNPGNIQRNGPPYDPTPDPPPEDTITDDPNEMHSHSETHSHGGASHTHTGSHRHTTPHPHASPHDWHSHTLHNNQPTVNQPTVNQPTVNQPTVNQPTVTQPTVIQSTTVATGGTSEGTSSPQPAGPVATGSAPQERRPASPLLQPLRVTEYMVRDWSKGGAWIGNSNLPQWVELYNPNIEAVNLKGYTFQYATRFFANHPYTIHTLTLASAEDDTDGFVVAGRGVAILSTQQLREEKFSGIEATQVYNLNIENVLKRGWVLTDANGTEVQRIGRDAFSALRDPVAPRHQDGARVSYQVYLSEAPTEAYYYGDSRDIGSPGFYAQPAPAAPSAVIRKRVGTWASLKQ